MLCLELHKAHVTAKPVRRPFQCAVQPWDARHKTTTESPCHRSVAPYDKELLSATKCYPLLLIHVIVATHETSCTLRRVTYGMQTMELPHSCLIIATHEKSFALCRAAEITPQHRQILRPPGNLTTKISHISPNIALPRKVISQLS